MNSRLLALVAAAGLACAAAPLAAAQQWRTETVASPDRIVGLESDGQDVRLQAGSGWRRAVMRSGAVTLEAVEAPQRITVPPNGLTDSRVATGRGNIRRAWLAEPTSRYAHGVLGDAVEADRVIVEHRELGRVGIAAGPDAVFEDLEPRIVNLESGTDHVLVVKSYLARGASLAVIGEKGGHLQVVAETAPIGIPHRWLNPAGVADYDGDGHTDIAIVIMPHALGRLDVWSWQNGTLAKKYEIPDTSNHALGSRVMRMSATADFDGDGRPDLAIPSFDRRSLRIIAFRPSPQEIARIGVPARITTEIGLVKGQAGSFALVMGLENGTAVAVHR